MPPEQLPPTAAELLDGLPYGVMAVASDGTILRANAPAHELVPGLGTPAVARCSDLFACRAPGGPCERACFVAFTAGSLRASQEIRIDTPGGVSPGALWVTASPLVGRDGAILHLRPGWRGDRRRRSENRWSTGPELRIRALGHTRVEALQDSLDGDWLTQRPGLLLKYLACERSRVVLVDEIADALWPDSGRRAVANARYAIHRLRLKLEPRRAPHGTPSFVVSRGSGYALASDRVWIDVDEFERAVEEGRAAMLRIDPETAARHLDRAMGLYGGPFLADEPYAHWAVEERNRLAGLAIYALNVLTVLARERGDEADAIRRLERLAEIEPLDNGVHRQLIQALLGVGRRGDALRRFEHFTHRLARDLDERPDFDIRDLSADRPSA